MHNVYAAGVLVFTILTATTHAFPSQRTLIPSNESLANAHHLNPYPNKPRVTFRPDGTFKLTVFSDLHFGENPWDSWGPQQDVNSLKLMRTVLGDEKPDYVVVNGDLITGENTFRENSTSLVDELLAPINEAGVPFSSTHGNHDNQANITHLEEIRRELRVAPKSYTRIAPAGVGGQGGPGNYWVPIYRNTQDPVPVLILWFFDSRGGFTGPGALDNPVPDWVDASVAVWIESESKKMDDAWGVSSRDTRGAVAHAIQAVQATLDSNKNPGLNADTLGSGSTQDTGPTSAAHDAPFWDALNTQVRNLHVVVSGHDHGNEWCAREPSKDVIFCFDKHSGYGGYGEASWGKGVRNIYFNSTDPTAGVDTWIRLEDGEVRAKVRLDRNYR